MWPTENDGEAHGAAPLHKEDACHKIIRVGSMDVIGDSGASAGLTKEIARMGMGLSTVQPNRLSNATAADIDQKCNSRRSGACGLEAQGRLFQGFGFAERDKALPMRRIAFSACLDDKTDVRVGNHVVDPRAADSA